MEDQNAPALAEPTSHPSTSSALPAIAPGLDKTELRQKMIEILASTANGCLQELGYYPGIHAKLQQVEKRASELQGENIKLFNDNQRLFAVANQQQKLIEQLKAEDNKKANTIQHLNIANAALTKSVEVLEAALLNKGGAGPAEHFISKYNSLLKAYQTLSREHTQARHLLQAQRNQINPALPPQQQAQQPPHNFQQTHQAQSIQQQQQQQQQQQSQRQTSTQYLPQSTAPSHPFTPVATPSIFTSSSSHPVHHPTHQQNVVHQQQMQPSGTSSNRRPSGSMPGPSQQLPVQVQSNPSSNMQQQQQQQHPIPGHIPQYNVPSVPSNQPQNPYPNGPAHPPQRANTYPVQYVQHPQPHPPQPQMGPVWTSHPSIWTQPAGNNSQPAQGLWVNTSGQGTSSPRTMSSPQTLAQTPNSASFPSASPHHSQVRRSSATPNAPSRPSSLSQASSPIAPLMPMPQNQPVNVQTPLHSPALKRNSFSISDIPNQTTDELSNKRPRIDGPSRVPKDISGLPSPVTPSVQHVHTMPGLEASVLPPPPPPPTLRLQSSPAQRSSAPPAQLTQPVNPPVTPAQSQSPQPSQPVVKQIPQQEHVPEAEAMAVDAEQSSKPDSAAETPMEEDTRKQAGEAVDEDEEEEETVEVGPDGLRLVSDCLDDLFGKDRSGTFTCKFCVVRHKMKLMSEPPVSHESPSDEVLAQHLMADHKTVWDQARAVDD